MAAKKSSVSKIKLKGVDTLFGIEEPKQDGVQEVCLSELKPFEDHPFQVIRDEKMEDLMESISEHGVLVPGLARPNTKGREAYELIAGHRRKFACQELQLATMPLLQWEHCPPELSRPYSRKYSWKASPPEASP